MAEAVAAAASVAGLASLALQLTETVATLRRFYRSVRNASETLEELVDEVETITLALREVERDMQRSDAVGNAELLNRCLKSCQRGAKKLQDVVDKMTRLQTKSKGLGQLYIAIKAKDEEVILSDLERAKNSLAFTYQLYSEARRRADAERQDVALRKMNRQVTMLPAEVVVQMQSTAIWTTTSHQELIVEDDFNHQSTIAPQSSNLYRGSKRHGRAVGLRIPIPFWQKVWHLSVDRSISGWRMELQTYHIRQATAPIFEALRFNDLSAMKRMFASGEASPYDCLIDGRTLLELAGRSNALDIVRYLLDNFCFTDFYNIAFDAIFRCPFVLGRPLDWRLTFQEAPDRTLCRNEFYRVLLEQDSFGPLDLFSDQTVNSVCSHLIFLNTMDHVDHVLRNLPVPLLSIPFQTRFNSAVFFGGMGALPATFLRICGLRNVTTRLATAETPDGQTALDCAVLAINAHWHGRAAVATWADFARSLIIHGADIHHSTPAYRFTPLTSLLRFDLGGRSLSDARKMLKYWIDLVFSAGVDLWQYGAVEAALFTDHQDEFHTCLFFESGHCITGINFGPNPLDWSLRVCGWGALCIYKRITTPGDWTDERIPQRIVWFPGEEELHAWSAWEGVLTGSRDHQTSAIGNLKVFFDMPCDVEDVIDERPAPVESLVADTQDDHGIVQLLIARSRSSCDSFKRSKSQPPPIHRRKQAYTLPGRRSHHYWSWHYHLCPSDGLYRYGCSGYDQPYSELGIVLPPHYMALARCLQFNQGPGPPFNPSQRGYAQRLWDLDEGQS